MMDQRIPLKNKLLFGIGDMYAGGAFLLVGLLYLQFLTDHAGLTPALAGSVFLIGKIWDAVSDPLMGILSDRTHSHFGRRRVYFLFGILPVFLSFLLLWITLDGNSQLGKFLYYTFAYLLFNSSFTMVQVPYNAVLPAMTDSYTERASASGIRLTFSAISAIIAGTLPMLLIRGRGYLFMGFVFAILYAIPWVCVFLGTYERNGQEGERQTVRQTIAGSLSIFKNRSFRLHAGLFICSQSAVDILTTLFIYYLTYVLGRQKEFSQIMAALLIVPVLIMPVYTKLATRFSKTTPMHIGLSIWALALLSSLFLSPSSPDVAIYLIAAASGLGTASAVFVPWSILPDVTDVDQLISGRRREGIYSGMATLLRKLAQAVAVFLIGSLLDVVGYVPEVEQSPQVILSLRLAFGLLPVLLICAALIFSVRYRLDAENHKLILDEIARRKKNDGQAPDPRCIEICELVSGVPFSELHEPNGN